MISKVNNTNTQSIENPSFYLKRIDQPSLISRLVVYMTLIVAALGAFAVWDINFWPTDAKVFYIDASLRIPFLNYLSEIHQNVDIERIRWLHGKEIYILAASWFQWLLNDFESLRPFMLLGITSIAGSALLIFFIARRYWGELVGLICYLLFAGCMWSYVYILMAKHQTLGLLLYLAAHFLLFFISKPRWQFVVYALSGLLMGLSLFASTVSTLYLPYYLAGFIYAIAKDEDWQQWPALLKKAILPGVCIIAGILLAVCYVNFPNLLYNLKGFQEYVEISGSFNHFYYNQPYLVRWFGTMDMTTIRGGWLWIGKYFFVIMPILFPLYLSSLAYLVYRCFQSHQLRFSIVTGGLIFISLSSPMMAEIAQVAQYGANYFTSLIGIIALIGYACFDLKKEYFTGKTLTVPGKTGIALLTVVMALHIGINSYVIVTDIYPCRMVTTFLSRKIKELKPQRLFSYMTHLHLNQFIQNLNPDVYSLFRFVPMKHIMQVTKGYTLVPPTTGDSIYAASISPYSDFDEDLFLNSVFRKGAIEHYAAASFPTLANSKIWVHEEEILSYRKLILGHKFPDDENKARVWLLDNQKIKADQSHLLPDKDFLFLHKTHIRNIGTKARVYIYPGFRAKVTKDKLLKRLFTRISKVGNPTDDLRAYIYKVGDEEPVFIPINKHFASQPLAAGKLTHDVKEGLGVFEFNPPLDVKAGSYFFMIYRTGELDDKNYYRIHKEYVAIF